MSFQCIEAGGYAEDRMSIFVLVHGAWHGGWCWDRVRRLLRAQGHDVFTPTLTGVADRSHLLSPQVDLETHINNVANLLLWEDLSDVVLCGHSYGGCVVTGVADRAPERIAALVYLDAFVPRHGQKLYDLLPAEVSEQQIAAARQTGEGWRVPPIPAEFFKVNAADRAWVDRQCTPQSLATFQQPIRLTGRVDAIDNVSFILASDWEGSPSGQFYDQAKQAGWKTMEIACGHDVMLDRPAELTEALLSAAAPGGRT
jgi:pimeloyl-ACP methyl ester carboxylesterase